MNHTKNRVHLKSLRTKCLYAEGPNQNSERCVDGRTNVPEGIENKYDQTLILRED